jgi:hypothetical protein
MSTPAKVYLDTSFSLLRKHGACPEGYRKLARYLGDVDTYGEDRPIPIAVILESNGVADALWSLRACTDEKAAADVARRLAIQFARDVLPIFEKRYPNDDRPRKAIDAAEDFLAGKIDAEALLKARRHAAYAAAYAAAAYAAAAAAYAAAYADAAYAAAAYAAAAAAYAAAAAAYAADRLATHTKAKEEARARQAQMMLALLAFDEVTA